MLTKIFTKTALIASVSMMAISPALAKDTATHTPDQQLKKVQSEQLHEGALTLTGKVTGLTPDGFMLKYGENQQVAIDMDADGWIQQANTMKSGQMVTVYGVNKEDIMDRTHVKAGAIYVKDDNTYYFSSNNVPSTESAEKLLGDALDNVPNDASVTIEAKVTEVEDDSFTVALGSDMIEVSVEDLAQNPLEAEGPRKIEKGDIVFVSGAMDRNLFLDDEIDATKVINVDHS